MAGNPGGTPAAGGAGVAAMGVAGRGAGVAAIGTAVGAAGRVEVTAAGGALGMLGLALGTTGGGITAGAGAAVTGDTGGS